MLNEEMMKAAKATAKTLAAGLLRECHKGVDPLRDLRKLRPSYKSFLERRGFLADNPQLWYA
jgi:hypothetical protein